MGDVTVTVRAAGPIKGSTVFEMGVPNERALTRRNRRPPEEQVLRKDGSMRGRHLRPRCWGPAPWRRCSARRRSLLPRKVARASPNKSAQGAPLMPSTARRAMATRLAGGQFAPALTGVPVPRQVGRRAAGRLCSTTSISSMPPGNAGGLPDETYAAITALILRENGGDRGAAQGRRRCAGLDLPRPRRSPAGEVGVGGLSRRYPLPPGAGASRPLRQLHAGDPGDAGESGAGELADLAAQPPRARLFAARRRSTPATSTGCASPGRRRCRRAPT